MVREKTKRPPGDNPPADDAMEMSVQSGAVTLRRGRPVLEIDTSARHPIESLRAAMARGRVSRAWRRLLAAPAGAAFRNTAETEAKEGHGQREERDRTTG